jgi:orotidine-5'-phosphate decarboxylase
MLKNMFLVDARASELASIRLSACPTKRALSSDLLHRYSQARHCGFEVFQVNNEVIADLKAELNGTWLVFPGIELRKPPAGKAKEEVADWAGAATLFV